jgi:hypothetical protein
MPLNQTPKPEPMMAAGQAPAPQGGGDPKEEVKSQLVMLLTQAKKMAEQNGLDWGSIISEIGSNSVKSSPTVPHPPANPNRPPMMGG